MKYLIVYFSILPFLCCSQPKENKFNKDNYVFITQGSDLDYPNYPFIKHFQNRFDSNYTYKKIYFDSSYKQLLTEIFFYKKIPQGPFFRYVNGKLTCKGYFYNGQYDGERITYENDKIIERAYFKEGIKSGTWEEYDKNGKLINKFSFDNNGNIIKK